MAIGVGGRRLGWKGQVPNPPPGTGGPGRVWGTEPKYRVVTHYRMVSSDC